MCVRVCVCCVCVCIYKCILYILYLHLGKFIYKAPFIYNGNSKVLYHKSKIIIKKNFTKIKQGFKHLKKKLFRNSYK